MAAVFTNYVDGIENVQDDEAGVALGGQLILVVTDAPPHAD
ncbi:hypothetical protein [Caballeronia mineralivorans]|nr:hypothetical protein [Caballeronia mineralivorans]